VYLGINEQCFQGITQTGKDKQNSGEIKQLRFPLLSPLHYLVVYTGLTRITNCRKPSNKIDLSSLFKTFDSKVMNSKTAMLICFLE
jgi:hypothetical protein